MSLSDPVADMITRIRNGQQARLKVVRAPYSKLREDILSVLLKEGYIQSFKKEEVRSKIFNLVIDLKVKNKEYAITEINRVSKPGLRIYYSIADLKLKKFYNGLGIYILSTSKGIISDREAKAANVGGEVLCNVF